MPSGTRSPIRVRESPTPDVYKRQTVDISNRLVCFDIKGLGKNLKKPGMLIVQDAVWNTVTKMCIRDRDRDG